VIELFSATPAACPNGSFLVDAIEITSVGGTAVRYDSTGGFFITNWQTPKQANQCYQLTMTAQDGSTISRAFFKTKIDEDGDLYVTGGLEVPIWVRVDAERKLITFFTYVCRDLNEHPPFTEALANHLNTTVTLPSFYVAASEPDRLYGTYHASYEDGILGLATASRTGMKVLARAAILTNRAWTVPTLVGTRLYIRDRKSIAAFELGV